MIVLRLFHPTDCPDDLFNNMKLYCAKYIRVVKEINMSFLPYEAQVSVAPICPIIITFSFARVYKE